MRTAVARRWGERRRRRLERRQWRRERRMAGARLLRAFAAAYPDARFIEVGANDGVRHDHLRPHVLAGRWRGVMVEPVPYVFERLRRNYGGLPRVSLENAAIADRDGTLPFWHLGEVDDPLAEGLPSWYDALGSLSREAVLAHASQVPDLERRLVETELRCLTLPTLCAKHGLERIDLLAVDTEGYDAEVVGQLDLDRLRPRLILYEHYHLDDGERTACRGRLEAAGYETIEEHFDTFALDVTAADRLTRAFRRLRPQIAPVTHAEEHGR